MEKPESVRESLNSAIEEHKEDTPATSQPIYDRTEPNTVRDSLEGALGELADTNKLAEKAVRYIEEQKEITREARGDPKPEPKQADPDKPASIPTKAWEQLPEAAREYYRKEYREIAATRQRHAAAEELNTAIDKYLPSYKLSSKDRASIVKSMFHWVERFNSNDPNAKLAALEDLAQRYNIDLTQPPPASYYDNQNNYEAQQQAVITQQEHLYQQQVQQASEKIKPTLETYAKTRPHFEAVRGSMRAILASMWTAGTIPRDADLSKPDYLDMAYDAACKLAGLQKRGNERSSERPQHGSNKLHPKSIRATIRRAMDEANNEG